MGHARRWPCHKGSKAAKGHRKAAQAARPEAAPIVLVTLLYFIDAGHHKDPSGPPVRRTKGRSRPKANLALDFVHGFGYNFHIVLAN
jgi:hypothetical protein